MFNFFRIFSKKLAIDLGTANTLVYVPHKGIVIDQPSVVAFDTQSGNFLAIGQKARKMLGKVPSHIKVVRPLKDGVIADFKLATAMLKYFIQHAVNRSRFLRPQIVIAIPSGITEVEKNAIREAAFQVGASQVTLILEPMAAALGAGLPVQSCTGSMVVDIGGGTTDVAVIALSGIVAGHSIRVAGDEMDEAIIRYLRHKYNLLIGPKTAELLKHTIGSAYPLKLENIAEICGRDLSRGGPMRHRISSEEIRDALAEPVAAIVEAVRITLENTPPEVLVDVMEEGIILTGGGSLLKNLDYKIKEEVGLPVSFVDEPLISVAIGTGKAASEPDLLKKIAVSE